MENVFLSNTTISYLSYLILLSNTGIIRATFGCWNVRGKISVRLKILLYHSAYLGCNILLSHIFIPHFIKVKMCTMSGSRSSASFPCTVTVIYVFTRTFVFKHRPHDFMLLGNCLHRGHYCTFHNMLPLLPMPVVQKRSINAL